MSVLSSISIRQAALFVLIGLMVTIPLPLHWMWQERPYYPLYIEFTSFSLYPSDILTLLLLLLTALWHRRSRQILRLDMPLITLPLLLLALVALLSAHWAIDAALAAHFATRLLLLFALYLTLLQLRPPPAVIYGACGLVLVSQGITAVLQFIWQHDVGLQFLGELDLAAMSGASIITVGQTFWLRGYGLTPHPNILGGLLAALFFPVTAAYFTSSPRRRWLWAAVLVLGLAGIMVSFSRAAWLSLLIGGSLLLLSVCTSATWRQQYGRLLVLPLLISLILVTAFAWQQRDLFLVRLGSQQSQTETRSIDERRVLSTIAVDMIQETPWQGVGAGQSLLHIAYRVLERPGVSAQPIHNIPLLITAELGLITGALWIWLMLVPTLFFLYQQWRYQEMTPYTLGLTASLVVFATTDLFDHYSWSWQQGRMFHWVLFGLWAGAVGNRQKARDNPAINENNIR